MELFSAEFFSALLAIIVIDLVLAGDNAIVIALAARNLPPHLRRRAIIWGTFGAIAVRTAMTLVVVWLLKVPGLLAIGGLLLIWIAWKLIVENESEHGDGHGVDSASGFFGAMKTIIVADALMGLDNVLAVAGAAQGSFLLVVLGLLISIPIVIWGSQLILKFVVRFPIIVYIGSGVLAWTSVKMVVSEPLIKGVIEQAPGLAWAAYLVVIGGVLAGGFLANHGKVRTRVARHLVDLAAARPEESAGSATHGPAREFTRVLVPIDGSANSLKAVRHAVDQCGGSQPLEVHLLHVRTPLSQYVARFLGGRDRAAYHRDAAEKALRAARRILDGCSVPYVVHVEFGAKAQTICSVAQTVGAVRIVMGTARKSSLTRIVEDSVTSKVLAESEPPVEVVAGESVSRLERYGIPAAASAIGGMMLVMLVL